jgi:glycine/D-amino acid oxidase-like deaminating enzyme
MAWLYTEEMEEIMNFDYVIIGAGIQGWVLLDRMRALGLNVCCVEPGPHGNDDNAHRLPFYIDRGHSYAEQTWIDQLHHAYTNWQNMVRRLGVRIRATESYVGFVGDSKRWTEAWDAVELPYTRTAAKTGLLAEHRLNEVFSFPHMLVDSRELLVKLRQANADLLKVGTLRHVSPCWQGYRLFVDDRMLTTRKLIVCAGGSIPDVLDGIEDLQASLGVQTRVSQVLTMRGAVAQNSIVVPDAQISIAPRYTTDGSTVLMCTHGRDPIHTGKNHRIDIGRLEKQVDALRSTLPGLSEACKIRGIYTTLQTEIVPSGERRGANNVFVQRLFDDLLYVLPVRPSFAMSASDQVLSMLNLDYSSAPPTVHATCSPYLSSTHFHQEFKGVEHA